MSTIKKTDEFMIPQGMNAKQTAKMLANTFGVAISDFVENGKKLIYSPKRKVVYKKPVGMTVKDYFEKIVLPNNNEVAAQLRVFDNEKWLPIQNIGRYFDGEVDYSQFYEVSDKGRIKLIDCTNAMECKITCGYDTPTRNAMQFTLNDRNGKRTTSDVKYMVADAFLGEHDIAINEVIHIDGDYHNNNSDNLMWVTR